MAICKLCGKNKAVVRDRESISMEAVVCKECHARLLRGDMKTLAIAYKKRRQKFSE